MSTLLDPNNIPWSPLEPGTLVSRTTLPDKEVMNQTNSLENEVLAIISKDEEYDQILNMVYYIVYLRFNACTLQICTLK